MTIGSVQNSMRNLMILDRILSDPVLFNNFIMFLPCFFVFVFHYHYHRQIQM